MKPNRKEESEKGKENTSPAPPIREKRKVKEENPSSSSIARARGKVGEAILHIPSRCREDWHPTLEQVIEWTEYYVLAHDKSHREWIKWWYEQMVEVYEWRFPDNNQFINWKSTVRAWWHRELVKRKLDARGKGVTMRRADNYIPHDPSQKKGFFDA